MKTPIRILFWTFVHDKAEHLWGYIWRKKLAPYHEQKWKERMENLENRLQICDGILSSGIYKSTSAGWEKIDGPVDLEVDPQALTFNPWDSSRIGDAAGYDLYSSTPGSGYNKIKEVRWDTEKWIELNADSSRSSAPQQAPETFPVAELGNTPTKP